MRSNKYKLIHEISEVIARTSDPMGGLSKVTKLLHEHLGSSESALFAYNAQDGAISLVAAHGVWEEQVGTLSFNLNEGLTGIVIRSGKMLNVDDQNEYRPRTAVPGNLASNQAHNELHGLCIAPLELGGSIIGAIVLARRQKRKFSKSILDTLEEISAPLAMFITNALLLRQNLEGANAFSLHRERPAKSLVNNKPLRGRPITRGVVCGHAIIVSGVDDLLVIKRLPPPVNSTKEQIEAERKRYLDSVEVARKNCQRTAREMAQSIPEGDCEIFEMHAMLLDDPSLKKTILKYIGEGHSLNMALAAALRTFSAQYQKIEDPYLRERLFDIKDVLLNIKNAADNLDGKTPETPQDDDVFSDFRRNIVIAHDLLPSQLVGMPLKKVTGIVLEDGGATSHVAILARALQIPMVVGVPWIKELVHSGDSILLDADVGNCYVRPSVEIVRQFGAALKLYREQADKSKEPCTQEIPFPSQTKDGAQFTFAGNFALLSELPMIRHYGISEIGLYRTEFMFMIRNVLPTEEEQFAVLKKLVTTAEGAPVNIRLLDAGGDKPLPYMNAWSDEDNPALGCRGLRFLLANLDIMMPHLRAILRATAFGNVNVLLPMVADLFDFHAAKEALKKAEQQLIQENIPVFPYKLGVMLEIPALFHVLEILLPHIDFVSIGTNDLVQFLFAVDRGNPALTRWYRQCHPVVLRIIRDTCRIVAKYPGKYVSLCGELAGSKRALPLLIGAGIRKLSMTPSRVPMLKEQLQQYDVPWCESLLEQVLSKCGSEMETMKLLEEYGIKS
jgi:phosphoenolpyruvate-protein phosphotransferase